jgi:alkylated DNA repair dioxygenase AlkB
MANICSVPAVAPAVTWQPSLLATAPDGALSFGGARRAALAGGAWVEHVPSWLAVSDDLCARLIGGLPWSSNTVTMYDRIVVEPRLTDFRVHAHLEHLAELEDVSRALSRRYGRPLCRIGAALYRNGDDSVAWHGDRISPAIVDPVVAIVSLGAPRVLRLRRRGGGPSTGFVLHGGDLLVMGGTCQRTWQHCVPKSRRALGPRVSVMFREPEPAGR